MIEIPDDVAKAIARWMREEVGPTPSGYHKDWPDLLDPKPPTLRERVAKEVGDIVRLALPLVSHDAPEWDAEQADAVLAVVADWLAAQPLMDKDELYRIAEKRPVTRGVRHDPSATTDPQSASVSPEEALTVRCGTCDADPGEACVTVGPWPGRVQRYPHESRYGKAREARPSATTDGGAG